VVPAVELTPQRLEQLVQRRVGVALEEARATGGQVLAIRTVTKGTPAAKVGLQKGDLVREVNGVEVSTLDEFRRAASGARRTGQLVLLVQRGYAGERIAFDLD
jgi:S1-C subfamily serine protease